MLIIQWLDRLPESEGILIVRKTTTNCDSAAEANAQAFMLWPTIRTSENHRPDGFQVVDQDDRPIQLAQYIV